MGYHPHMSWVTYREITDLLEKAVKEVEPIDSRDFERGRSPSRAVAALAEAVGKLVEVLGYRED